MDKERKKGGEDELRIGAESLAKIEAAGEGETFRFMVAFKHPAITEGMSRCDVYRLFQESATSRADEMREGGATLVEVLGAFNTIIANFGKARVLGLLEDEEVELLILDPDKPILVELWI